MCHLRNFKLCIWRGARYSKKAGSRYAPDPLKRKQGKRYNRLPCSWWTRRDSNPRPLGCEPNALPTELRARPYLVCINSDYLDCVICWNTWACVMLPLFSQLSYEPKQLYYYNIFLRLVKYLFEKNEILKNRPGSSGPVLVMCRNAPPAPRRYSGCPVSGPASVPAGPFRHRQCGSREALPHRKSNSYGWSRGRFENREC